MLNAAPSSSEAPSETAPPTKKHLLLVFFGFFFIAVLQNLNLGAFIHDEGHFLLVANTISQGFLGLLSGQPLSEIKSTIHETGGALYFTGKPGYPLLLAFWGTLTLGITAAKAQLLSILIGSCGVLAFFVTLFRRLGPEAATMGVVFLILNPFYVSFQTQILGVGPAISFVLIGFWLVDREYLRPVPALLGALAFTVAFLCHYHVLPLIGILWLISWKGGNLWKRVGVPAAFLGFLVLLHIGTLVVDKALESAYPEFKPYGNELLFALGTGQVQAEDDPLAREEIPEHLQDGVRGYGPKAWAHVPLMLLRFGNVLPFVAFASLIFLAIRRYRRDLLFYSVWAFAPFILWWLYPWKVDRSFVQAMPGMAALCALTVHRFWASENAKDRGVIWFVGGAAVVFGLMNPTTMGWFWQQKSPFAKIVNQNASWIESAPEGTFTKTSFHWRTAPLWKWYLGGEQLNKGRPSPGINFSSAEEPLVIGRGAQAILPDWGYAAYLRENEWVFAVGSSYNSETDHQLMGFFAKSYQDVQHITGESEAELDSPIQE